MRTETQEMGLGDVERGTRLGDVMNKPGFCAEFLKYYYKDREENTPTYKESPP